MLDNNRTALSLIKLTDVCIWTLIKDQLQGRNVDFPDYAF